MIGLIIVGYIKSIKKKVEILLSFKNGYEELLIVNNDVKEVHVNYQGKPYLFKMTDKKDKYGRHIFIVGKERKTLQPCIHTFKDSLFTNEPFCIKCKIKQNENLK